MIYTVTFNPSLDYVVNMTAFNQGAINRTEREKIYPGGKGINVSIVLGHLGIPSKALGFMAGFTGREIERRINEHGCDADFIEVKEGYSRINVKVSAQEETAINGMGPKISQANYEELLTQLYALEDGDTLILAGSIPSSLSADVYEDILYKLADKKLRVVVDATGDLLLSILKFNPFLIKPNEEELGELFHTTLTSLDSIIEHARLLQQRGARNVLVSLGGNGAVLIAEDGHVYHQVPPRGNMVNSVGAGDSMVAGFIAGSESVMNYKQALQLGIACGSATAFHEWLATNEEIKMELDKIKT